MGVDIGGTFTDCVAVAEDGSTTAAKTLSTHATSPVDGVMNGIRLLANTLELSVEDLLFQTRRFSHGTTIGTNLVVERKGSRVGLLATKGHGDAILMMRGSGRTAGLPADQIFDSLNTPKPDPLVTRQDVAEVEERVASDGAVVARLNEESARAAIDELIGQQVDAFSVALLWATVNPDHERRIAELIEEARPGAYVSLSSDVSPRQGEYERTVATVINSYVGPASSRYLDELAHTLDRRGLTSKPYILQSSGGVLPLDEARSRPVSTIGSGPAGGLAGTRAIARALGHRNVIATDMGGTSFEVGLIVDGEPTLSGEEILDKYAFHLSHLDLRSIACGGGSIASIDPHSGGLRVGPESAGADPGPACYGHGTQPTVTDADVVLGLIDPTRFLGGRMELNVEAARRAVGQLADELGLSLEEAAAGIITVNGHSAGTLIRQRTVEQGLDPRDFVVYAYGGAGPVHAFWYARELGVSEVIIPLGNGASTLSAYGAAGSDLVRSAERQCSIRSAFNPDALAALLLDLEASVLAAMRTENAELSGVEIERFAMMRYQGQYLQELTLRMPLGDVDRAYCQALEDSFTWEYVRLYGEAALALFQPQEIFAVRVSARVPTALSALLSSRSSLAEAQNVEPSATRQVYWPGTGRRVETRIYTEPLEDGDVVDGPAIVELPYTSVSVAPGQNLRASADHTLTLLV
jgi:N-methylhydantoinase A